MVVDSQFNMFRAYEESVGLGSYTDEKTVVLSKNDSEYPYQLCGT